MQQQNFFTNYTEYFRVFFLAILTVLNLFCNLYAKDTQKPLVINVFAENNGKGLQNGRTIFRKALEDLGHVVFERERSDALDHNPHKVDINIFFETINQKWLDQATYNWFIPNPEWCSAKSKDLKKIDLIVCRTHESERIFQALGKKTFYLGFTSRDCLQTNIDKNFSSCIHLVGGSQYKGTSCVLAAWDGCLSMPALTVIIHDPDIAKPLVQENINWIPRKIPFDDLRILHNSCGIHVCVSEVEGYGHYIAEAMSTEAVVITTDAPPMNEFITDKRCLISYTESAPVRLGTKYKADPIELREKILYLQNLPREEFIEIGKNNRKMYLQNQQNFYKNLEILMENGVKS